MTSVCSQAKSLSNHVRFVASLYGDTCASQKSCASLQCSMGLESDRVRLSEYSLEDLLLVKVLVRCLNSVLRQFLLMSSFLETLLLGQPLVTFSPHRNERLTRVAVQASFNRFLFVFWSAGCCILQK